jgi:hypothetical protein
LLNRSRVAGSAEPAESAGLVVCGLIHGVVFFLKIFGLEFEIKAAFRARGRCYDFKNSFAEKFG